MAEVFKTEHGAIWQCNHQNCFWLDFNNTRTLFKISDLFAFKKRIDQIDLNRMIEDPSPASDYEIIMPFRTERCFILSVNDILHLRELLSGAKFMIQLNSEVKSCLNRGSYLAIA